MNFEIEVKGDQAIIAHLDALPAKLRASLVRKISYLTLYLENYIKTQKLSGQVLNVVTGRLRRSIFSRVTDTGNSVEGSVSSSGDVKYAAIHEFGFNGEERVRAHTRQIKEAFGRAITPKTVHVREFTREMHMPERSFIRSAFRDLKSMLQDGVREAIEEGLRP
jgi:phage gpG-like protein